MFEQGLRLLGCLLFQQHDDGDFDLVLALFERGACGGGVGAGGVHGQAQGPFDQLGVGRMQVDHQVAVGFVQPHHQGSGQGVEHDFLRRAGLQPRAAGDEFGAGVQQDGVVAAG